MANADSREEVLKLLSDLAAFYGSYHNHKETSAWVCTALYLALLAQSAIAIDRLSPLKSLSKVGIWISVLAIFIFVINFVIAQFKLRTSAQQRLEACFRLRCKIVSEPGRVIDFLLYAVDGGDNYPKAIKEEIEYTKHLQQGLRPLLERLTYGLLAVTTAGLLLQVLIS